MSTQDFLFEGDQPTSVRSYGSTVENVPKWLSDYTHGLIARANAIAAEPYMAYGGPRIAGFTPDQYASMEATRQNVGRSTPYITEATRMALQSGQTSPLQTAAPYLQSASRQFTGDTASQYMNPYVQNVLDRQEALAQRTLEEKFLPQLQKSFIGAGQFGSSQMMDKGMQGVRDIQENLEQQRLATLSDAYRTSADIFGQDASRMAQLAPVAGNLATAGAELGLAGAQQLGALGEFASAQGLRDAAALEAVGQQQQQLDQRSLDLAYQDFIRQQQYPRETIDWLSQTIRGGLPSAYIPQQTVTETVQPGAYQPSNLAQLAGTLSTIYGMTQ